MAETNSRSRGEQAFDAALMAAIRERFHHVDRCPVIGDARIFLESGGGSLRLIAAIERVAEVAALPDQEARDNEASRHLSAILNRGRDDLRTLFGATGGQVISGETGTRLLYRLIRAVAVSAPPGPVISCTLEHPASLDAAKQWAANTGRPWHEVPFDPRSGVVAPADYAAIVTPDTQLATVIHTSQLTGFTVDLAGIVAAVRATAPQCFVIVDGIQYVPHGAVAVEDYGADAYVFSPYKAYSRVGAGFAWLNERIAAIPHEHMLGGHADNWELGSRDPGLYAAQSAVTDYLCWLGGHFTDSADRRGQLVAAATAMAAHERYLVSLLLAGDNEVAGPHRHVRRHRHRPARHGRAPGHRLVHTRRPGLTRPGCGRWPTAGSACTRAPPTPIPATSWRRSACPIACACRCVTTTRPTRSGRC